MKHVLIILLLSVLLILSCAKKKEKTYVVVCFDVEDYTTPESEGIDELPKWLAETMTEVGVTGTFFVIGEKARSLEKRGRTDVIEAMAKHDVGSHTNWGSIHPTVTELLENLNFKDGLNLMKQRESISFQELERIFGKPMTTFARHGGSYGPQLPAALSEMNSGYIYAPVFLPDHYVSWFCNTLNFYGEGYAGFDDVYYKDELFEPVLDSLRKNFTPLVQNIDGMSFFACHPCKVQTVQFWDFNYYYGANPDSADWKTPELRSAESMKTARKNFRSLMQFLKDRDDIEITTFSKLMHVYSYQRQDISVKKLSAIARRILDEKSVIIDDYYSAAETFAALAQMITEHAAGSLPKKVTIIRPYGPLQMPSIEPGMTEASKEAVVELAQKALAYIEKENALPHALDFNGEAAGTGSLLALFSQFFLDVVDNKIVDVYNVTPFDAYPHENEAAIIKNVEDCQTWPVHRKDLDMTNLVEMTKMQMWTLKPAWSENVVVKR